MRPLIPKKRAGDLEPAGRAQAARGYIEAVHPPDTTAASHAAQLAVYRRLGASRRAQLAARLSVDVRRLSRSGIHARHPAYTDEEVDLALRRLLHGDELFRRAWPGRPLLSP